ncbi:hypothetical protein BKA69DRAFT_1033137 [Paraphysoderma sedebokerense]|nr:hypothetical protein BKA69DRAFT_1033137 [Paraphysoderma sedebokerense]
MQFLEFPNDISQHKTVVPIFKSLSTDSLKSNLETLCVKHPGRYFNTSTGEKSAKWIQDTIASYIPNKKIKSNVVVNQFKHSWKQPSIVARIEGQGKNREEVVVIGSHLDSIAYDMEESNKQRKPILMPFDQMPGCDDDGSGAVTLIEAFKALMTSNATFSRSVEFHWYAAEEIGLNGSRAIANNYREQGKIVHSMMQLDMVGYINNTAEEHLAINTANSNEDLMNLVKKMVQAYIQLPVRERFIFMDATDHASFNNSGYRAINMFEDVRYNPFMHTVNDTMDKISFTHMLQFAKLAVAYVVELAV